VVGVFKAYQTRVGAGPMPTELHDEVAETLRERGKEYGTVSGRPRSCGWFDAVAARFSARINGFTSVVVTRLDILDTLPQLKICTGYKLDGKTISDFPASVDALAKCRPVYEEMPGWQEPTGDVRIFKDLPVNARRYIRRLEEHIGCPASLISVGQRRDQTIVRKSLF
jgi:adenylosuccinate synthase